MQDLHALTLANVYCELDVDMFGGYFGDRAPLRLGILAALLSCDEIPDFSRQSTLKAPPPFYFSNQAVTQIRASAARYASNSLFKVSCKVSILCCRFKTTQSLILVVILARPATVLLACEVFFLFVSRDFPEYFLPAAPTAERGFAQPTLGKIL